MASAWRGGPWGRRVGGRGRQCHDAWVAHASSALPREKSRLQTTAASAHGRRASEASPAEPQGHTYIHTTSACASCRAPRAAAGRAWRLRSGRCRGGRGRFAAKCDRRTRWVSRFSACTFPGLHVLSLDAGRCRCRWLCLWCNSFQQHGNSFQQHACPQPGLPPAHSRVHTGSGRSSAAEWAYSLREWEHGRVRGGRLCAGDYWRCAGYTADGRCRLAVDRLQYPVCVCVCACVCACVRVRVRVLACVCWYAGGAERVTDGSACAQLSWRHRHHVRQGRRSGT